MSPRHLWERIQDSLWFLPTALTVAAAVLAPLMVLVDQRLLSAEEVGRYWWLFGGSPEGARGVLVAIAGSLITVTGVVFSITIVALQLASSQFTPRVLQNFTGDRGNQLVLGVFVGTFTYTLLLLRTVRAPVDDGAAGFVPAAGVTVAVALALVSIGLLIYYINHVATWIEASTIVDRVVGDTLHVIRNRFPEAEAEDAPDEVSGEGDAAQLPAGPTAEVLSKRSGYVQIVELGRLVELADDEGLVVRVEVAVGAFVLSGQRIASVWPRLAAGEEVVDAVRGAFSFGHRRTLPHDAELGLLQLSDIAVKALSPGINDPTTAMMALDRAAELVVELGVRRRRESMRGRDGTLRLLVPTLHFERVVDVAFSQARRYGGHDPALLVHLAGVVGQVARRVGAPQRRVLGNLLAAVEEQARIDLRHPADLAEVGRALEAARREV
jgi:uncharacterized membrane protein